MPLHEWPDPKRIFLITYDRLDHLSFTVTNGIVGAPNDGASCASKANQLRIGDWVLLRLTQFKEVVEHLLIYPPARVTGLPILQGGKKASPWPDLLWQEEIENKQMKYPMRVPVAFDSDIEWNPKLTWQDLTDLRLRGINGNYLETPSQWGIKLACNIIDAPFEVRKLINMVRNHARPKQTSQRPSSQDGN